MMKFYANMFLFLIVFTISANGFKVNTNGGCNGVDYFPNEHDCNIYHQCLDHGPSSSHVYTFHCAGGTVFEPTNNTCVHPQDSSRPECLNAKEVANEIDNHLSANDKYVCKREGFHPDPKDCHRFVRCVDFGYNNLVMYSFACGPGTVWDQFLLTCNHAWAVSGRCGLQSYNNDVVNDIHSPVSTSKPVWKPTVATSNHHNGHHEAKPHTSSYQSSTVKPVSHFATHTTPQFISKPAVGNLVTQSYLSTTLSTTSTGNDKPLSHTISQTTSSYHNGHHQTKPQTISYQSSTGKPVSHIATHATSQTTSNYHNGHHETKPQTMSYQSSTGKPVSHATSQTTAKPNLGTQPHSISTLKPEISTNAYTNSTMSVSTMHDDTKLDHDELTHLCPTSFRRHPRYCNLFFQCLMSPNGFDIQTSTFQCPEATIYDRTKIQCVYSKDATHKCSAGIYTEKLLKSGSDRKYKMMSDEPFCPSQGSFAINGTTCSNNFIKCEMDDNQLQGYVYQCPEQYIFSSDNNSCKSVETVPDCDADNVTGLNLEIPVETDNISS